jgi:AcrR family transcriptional regulator
MLPDQPKFQKNSVSFVNKRYAGLKAMFRSGYTAASVRDICEAAGVPLGSFTNHFRSKEAFAQEVLDRYFAGTKQFVKEALDDKSLTPLQRLKRYLDIISSVARDLRPTRTFGKFLAKRFFEEEPRKAEK